MKSFDLQTVPLAGTHLIEASAGTGKTYTIAGLVARLILEKGFTPDEILVVTFTTAATEELRERIRNRLLETKSELETGGGQALPGEPEAAPPQAISRLNYALVNFDRSAIFTIHGFCQRILQENAFETASLLDTELVADNADLLLEVAEDFWRRNYRNLPPEILGILRNDTRPGPGYYAGLLTGAGFGDLVVIPETACKPPEFKSLQHFRDLYTKLKSLWPESRSVVIAALSSNGLHSGIYGNPSVSATEDGSSMRTQKVAELVARMDRLVEADIARLPLFDEFEKLTAAKLASATLKHHRPPDHIFFKLCNQLNDSAAELARETADLIRYLKCRFLQFAPGELARHKQNRNLQYFDDLLTRVADALKPGSADDGSGLKRAVRRRYRAALIDEFQDTDSLQWRIFSSLFRSPGQALYMIGDPKQAIYGFRGADIFTYLDAVRKTPSRYTLTRNWRSSPELVDAVNTFFSTVSNPFVFESIPFLPVLAAKPLQGPAFAGMTIWHVANASADPQQNKKAKPIAKAEATDRMARAVADEIADLLAGRPPSQASTSGTWTGRDIAVLVRTHRQAAVVKNRLDQAGIPSILYQTESLFDSREARELAIVLEAIARPNVPRCFKTALATDLMGCDAQQLDSAQEGAIELDATRARFFEYARIWQHHGFFPMFQQLLSGEKVRMRLLAFSDGERRMTNLLHLGEVLHRQSLRIGTGIRGVLKWLADRRSQPDVDPETAQLRLESEGEAVTILTVHKSKGLEFPVVFSLVGWEPSRDPKSDLFFHDPQNGLRPTLDLGSEHFDDNKRLAEKELLAENLRLLYVAMTRAKQRLYLAWGRINGAETSALAYLLHNRHREDAEDPAGGLKSWWKRASDKAVRAELDQLAAVSRGSIRIDTLPASPTVRHVTINPAEPAPGRVRQFTATVPTRFGVKSYSSLVHQAESDIAVDRDGSTWPANPFDLRRPAVDPEAIFAFPKGSRAGSFFHEVLEAVDFASVESVDSRSIIRRKLEIYGLEDRWCETVCNTLQKVVTTPLRAPAGQRTFHLAEVSPGSRLNELGFYFPLERIDPRRLAEIFTPLHIQGLAPDDFAGRLGRLTFAPTEGFMRGFMDLVFQHEGRFYLVDWKTNWLGDRTADYLPDRLAETMSREYYILQYHLYLLALNRYLRLRLPSYEYETHFGAVFYIFVRGLDPAAGSGSGVFIDRPDPERIGILDQVLIQETPDGGL